MLFLIFLVILVFLLYKLASFIKNYKSEGFYHHFELKGPMVDTQAYNERIMRPLDIKKCNLCTTIERAAVRRVEDIANGLSPETAFL